MTSLQTIIEVERDRAQVEQLSRFGQLDPRSGHRALLDQAQARLKKQTLPTRDQARKLFENELTRLHSEWSALRSELVSATKAELAATERLKTAQTRHNFATYRPALCGLDPAQTLKEQINANAHHADAIKRRTDIEARGWSLEGQVNELYGCVLAKPETWPAAIERRLDKLFTDEATEQNRSILTALGLQNVDRLLSKIQ